MNEIVPTLVVTKPDIQQTSGAAVPQQGGLNLVPIWRRRWTVLVTTLICVAAGAAYLLIATPIFTGASSLYIEQNGVKITSDSQGAIAKSDTFLFSQRQVILSGPILLEALQRVDYKKMKTFQRIKGYEDINTVVDWMQREKDFTVEVGKKDDVVKVSFDSPYAHEAADVVNAVVDAYMTSQSEHKRTTADEMLRVLEKEKERSNGELVEAMSRQAQFKKENGSLSFTDDRGNIVVQRLVKLSDALTQAELETLQAKAEYEASRVVLADPGKIHDFVQGLEAKGQPGGDHELDGLRDEFQRALISKAMLQTVNGPHNSVSLILEAQLTTVKEEIAKKERGIAAARLAKATEYVNSAQKQEDDLRSAFELQKKIGLELNAKTTESAKLDADVTRVQKQNDAIDERMKELNVNEDGGALNIRVLEVAHADPQPSKPKKALVIAAMLLGGLLLGIGLAFLREYLEHRLRTPDEITAALGAPILGVVPHISRRLTVQMRGQQVHRDPMSDVAETYRTIRTAIQFSAMPDLKTILVTSPRPGDGKSMAASNLAIALAQAGLRTLLLDADFRKPVQHKIFEADGKTGLSSVIAGKGMLRDAIRRTNVPHLCILPCGPLPDSPSEMIAGPRFNQVMEAVTRAFDRVVIDSPPVMAVADAQILAVSADATLLIIRINKTPRKASILALEGLKRIGANVIGVVVNDMRRADDSGYGYYGYGYYGGGYYATKGRRQAAANRAELTPPVDGRYVAEEALQLSTEVLALGDGSGANGNHGSDNHANGKANGNGAKQSNDLTDGTAMSSPDIHDAVFRLVAHEEGRDRILCGKERIVMATARGS